MSEQQVIPVRVALRARPLIPREESEGCQSCLWFHPQEPQVILGKDKAFTFDYIFSPTCGQAEVYHAAAQQLVDSTFQGYNATVLAYGQTGSGKTFSMGGCYEASLSQDEDAMGIIPRILRDLFQGIKERPQYSFKVMVTYLEIYNEELLDLLCPVAQRQTLTIREENGEIKIKGIREVGVGSFEDTVECLVQGAQSRTTGATAMNDTSSRSHAIFTVYIDRSSKEDMQDHCVAKFHLVDLAGSERAKRTRAEGDRFKEGVNINKGLLSLGNVISALGEEGNKRGHIPYRDSKLTRLLQDSLGGNSHTLMVACVSPADSNMEETLNTLRYADRARKIKNKPVINRDPQSDEILRLRQVVESLQMQLLQRGDQPITDISSIVPASSSASAPSQPSSIHLEEVTRLTERGRLLEKENRELSRELERALEQNTRMCASNIHLETARDTLLSKLQSLKDNAGVDVVVLREALGEECGEQVKGEVDKVQTLTDCISSLDHIATEESELSIEEEEEEETKEDGNETQEDVNPELQAKSREHVLRQAKMSRELQELNSILSRKQELANQMTRSEGEIDAMRSHYEAMMKDWEEKVNHLETEKKQLTAMLDDTRSSTNTTTANTSKVSEQRRKRLQELETEMSTLRRKMAEQSKAVKLKAQSDKHITHLNTEIVGLKQQRVKLMKQMKEEGDTWRRWKQQKDKEVIQLMQKDRKRQAELAKLRQTSEKQQNVLKRKVEEAAAANRRLKEALLRQKAVATERASKAEGTDKSSIASRIRKWLSHELEVRVSVREARYHMMSLINDRKELSQQKRQLQDQLDSPSAKKQACEDEAGRPTEKSSEEEDSRKQIDNLTMEIELRNVQIQDLQQKICDADQAENKEKSMWESVHTMMEAKCALKWLLEQAVDGKADQQVVKEELKAHKERESEDKATIAELRDTINSLTSQHHQQLMQMQKDHQQKTMFLLNMEQTSKSEGPSGDEALKRKLDIQAAELSKMSSVMDDLEKKTVECEELRRKMTSMMMVEGKVALMPSIHDPDSSPFRTPRPKPQGLVASVRKLPPIAQTPQTPGSFCVETDEDWDEDDEEDDPNWRLTPLMQKTRKVRSSGLQCGCKTDCTTKRCSCTRNGRQCSSDCACNTNVCLNQQPDTTVSSSSAVMNSTFDIVTSEEDSSNTTTTTTMKPPTGRGALRTLNTKKTTRSSKTKLLDLIQSDEARSSDEFEKPTPLFAHPGPGKRSIAHEETEEFKTENSKRRRTMLNTTNVQYFSPPKNE